MESKNVWQQILGGIFREQILLNEKKNGGGGWGGAKWEIVF